MERHRQLLKAAEARFAELRLSNITTRAGDGYKGWTDQAPSDRIIVTAPAPEIPPVLIDQLAPGGILVIPVGRSSNEQNIVRVTQRDDHEIEREILLPVRFVPLVAGPAKDN